MGKTRGVNETTPELRNRMIGMYEAGLGLREIAAAVNCSQRTVKRWLNRFSKEGTVETRNRCGRKRATTQEQDNAIIQLAIEKPITAAKAVLPALGLSCSVDTIRERLHKAGIHNWSPSKKHIKKIITSDSSDIQQTVWRPTGTQAGTKKIIKEKVNKKCVKNLKSKKSKTENKKLDKIQDVNDTQNEKQSESQTNYDFSSSQQINSEINKDQFLTTSAAHSISVSSNSTTLNNDHNQYHNLHDRHSENNVRNWPLDLGNLISSNEPSSTNIQSQSIELAQSQKVLHETHNQSQHINNTQVKDSEKQADILDDIDIEEHLEICSDSDSSINENNLNSNKNNCTTVKNDKHIKKKEAKNGKLKKKAGGKIKGTLETSVEIRNRMIGMSEAGLSSLSIALAINRSERTVKRWLNRWKKEGHVQTKERKGRKRITTKEEDEAIVAMATQNPLTAAKYVAPALGLKCSVDTIRERLHKAGIHSWKLGKKQGEGSTVQTVHLWQPSGNRSNKLKASGEKKKKSEDKKVDQNLENKKKDYEKERVSYESSENEVDSLPATNVISEETNLQYHTQHESSIIMHPAHNLINTPIIQPQPIACSQIPLQPLQPQPLQPQPLQPQPLQPQLLQPQPLQPQPLQPQAYQHMSAIMQSRPDCRLAFSTIPHLTSQPPSISYPSCMMVNNMVNNSHIGPSIGHVEQSTDTMNYEPYVWSF